MLASLLIVFREVIEAGLVVGIVLAATKGVPHHAPHPGCFRLRPAFAKAELRLRAGR